MSWCNGYEGEKCFLCDEPTMYTDMEMVRKEWVCTECQKYNEENDLNTEALVIKERRRREAKQFRIDQDRISERIKANIFTNILINTLKQ